jgi:hypothetical protein
MKRVTPPDAPPPTCRAIRAGNHRRRPHAAPATTKRAEPVATNVRQPGQPSPWQDAQTSAAAGKPRQAGYRRQRRSEPPLPTNYSNFVHEQNGHRRQGGPDGQRVTSEEVQGHTYPAKANSYQGTTNIRRCDCCREARAKDVPEPKKLS